MASKTKQQLLVQNDVLIKANGNEEITGTVLNIHLKDIIDSVKIDDGVSVGGDTYLKSQTNTGLSIVGTNTSVTIQSKPLNQVNVIVNDLTYPIGTTANDKFYFKSSDNITVKSNFADITSGDVLHYNSSTLGYPLDNLDTVIIQYLTK